MSRAFSNPQGIAPDILTGQPLFKGMSTWEIELILQKANGKLCEFAPNTELETGIASSGTNRQIRLLLSGIAFNVKYDTNGNRSIIDYIMPGHVFQSSTFTHHRAPVQTIVTADKSCLILILTLPEQPEANTELWLLLNRNIIEILVQKNLSLLRKADVLSRRTLREKIITYLSYEREIHGSNEFDIPLSRQSLADYLYVDRTSLATEIGKLKKEGAFI